VLKRLPPALGRTAPVLRDLNAQLPDLRRALRGFAPLARPAIAGLRATATALREARPILAGLRAYGSDFILGIFNGLVGISTGPYDAGGHYVHLEFTQSPQQLLGGAAAGLFSQSLLPGVLSLRTKRDAPCPGSAGPPAPDLSSPWIPDATLCNPSHEIPASVNEP
jgi:hypothetical protein